LAYFIEQRLALYGGFDYTIYMKKDGKRSVVFKIARIAILCYIGLCAVVFFLQRRMIYFPTDARELPAGSTMSLDVGTAVLEISTRQADGDRVLIYFGGNAEDVSSTLPEFAHAFPEHSTYMMHYRGYGNSTSRPTEKALVADAIALYDAVAESAGKVILVGRSLGSGIAIRVADERPAKRLILVTPFDSILNIARRSFPYLPVRFLLLDKFQSHKYAQSVGCPTLIIIAEEDEVIPMESSLALADAFLHGMAEVRVIEGADHNSLSMFPEYMDLLQSAIFELDEQ